MNPSLAGERIAILGLARSGTAAARLALAHGASVYVSDAGDTPALRAAAEEIRELGGDAEVGRHDLAKLAAADRILLSPGIPPTAAVLRAPELKGRRIVTEMEFAWEQLDGAVLAVTGTNGKTTTTALIAHLLEAAGVRVAAGGNIGTALSELALRNPQPEAIALECSSFQLGRTERFRPDIGVLTNLAPDHLDWYASVDDYYADKAKLFQNAKDSSLWVLNGEDEAARALPGAAPGERYYFRVESPLPKGEHGGFLSPDGWLTLRLDGPDEPLIRAGEMRLLGRHNVANALAAAIAVRLQGAPADAIVAGLRTFGALPHRMETVTERGGVLWINDSKATNIASTEMALRSLDRPTVLLLGGRHKGEPYAALLPDLVGRVRAVLAFGEAAELVMGDLNAQVPVERVEGGLEEVVRRAAELARPGDAVLLSPACSSYDMFRNYEERGSRFRELVHEVVR
jgi:UDP-N-acetylmuramoylalanine--D-glutamate ligase